MALADLDRRLGVVGGCGSHALLYLASHGQESLLDVAGVFGRGLEEWDAQAVGELLYDCMRSVKSGSDGRYVLVQHVMRNQVLDCKYD